MIVAIWIISISISLPLGIYHKKEMSDDNVSYTCTEKWPKAQARQFFTVTSLVLQYIVPCTIISFCYSMVSFALRKRSKVKRNQVHDYINLLVKFHQLHMWPKSSSQAFFFFYCEEFGTAIHCAVHHYILLLLYGVVGTKKAIKGKKNQVHDYINFLVKCHQLQVA